MNSKRRALASLLSAAAALSGMLIVMMGPGTSPQFGDPLPGLSKPHLTRFREGKASFQEAEVASDGLGPVFTQDSCAKCHTSPAVGGGSAVTVTRIGRIVNGAFDPLIAFGGPLIQNQGIGEGTGANGPYDYVGEVVPPEATIVAGRRTTPLFGLGLVEAVPNATFFAIAHQQRIVTAGTAGRPHVVTDLVTGQTHVGRFGWKSQHSSLLDFSGDAYTNEMGVTTPLVPLENPPQGNVRALDANPYPLDVPNEPDNDDIVLFADYIRMLAPPPRRASNAAIRTGATVFSAIGCNACHVPSLKTGPNAVKALSNVTFFPYSDFLLHDMGNLGDGITQGNASGAEMRTAPLWGLSAQTSFLHDGRATTLQDAILAHDGQGRPASLRFSRLSAARKNALLAFLRSL